MPNFLHGVKMPTFPATWYHPIYGAREIRDYAEWSRLDDDWRETAGIADMDRTETEARVVANHNDQVKREQILQGARRAGIREDRVNDAIVRNSVQADEALKEGKAQPL
jgi:hypothetical protein